MSTKARAKSGSPISRLVGGLVVVAVIIGAIFGFIALTSFSRTDGGTTLVIRNGGPFDSQDIRQVLAPASPRTYSGMFSEEHPYPAQQRFYDIVPAGDDTPGVNAYRTPTSDGVDVGLTARLNFRLNTAEPVLRAFDDAYGTRTFQVPGTDERLAVWEGDAGFGAFLDVVIKPVLEETLRQQIGTVDCAELQASCALVQNSTPEQVANAAATGQGANNAEVLQRIQTNVQTALATNINRALGGDFLTNISFSLTGVDLPAQLRERIEAAQAEFAGASAAQARLNQARLDADANAERQRGYLACNVCAQIDLVREQGEAQRKANEALQGSGVTVYAPGGGTGINVNTPG
ncbi:SPFH domain-containing protein [Pseudonocardia aurantiaca]|uniref:SPFH domain-containing protein n=1 Tax=Pseudonocardia aurantiaca TaxID=75290 RepID=A0ABW4FJP4_9PSEU